VESSPLDWLLRQDPVVRFQTKRDLLDLGAEEWEPERQQSLEEGWGSRLLALQDADGTWGGGLYSPKYISTHYTLLLLRRFEVPVTQAIGRGCDQLIRINHIGDPLSIDPKRRGLCITGMGLGILAHFRQHEELFDTLLEILRQHQLADGGWNCRALRTGSTHSSVHTTLSALEGLQMLREQFPQYRQQIDPLQQPANEFLLVHSLFKSHRTGEVMHPQFTNITFPPRWRYNILSALDYFQRTKHTYDDRMEEALQIIKKQGKDGYWKKGPQVASKIHFSLNQPRKPCPYNTLRAHRVLKSYDQDY